MSRTWARICVICLVLTAFSLLSLTVIERYVIDMVDVALCLLVAAELIHHAALPTLWKRVGRAAKMEQAWDEVLFQMWRCYVL